jgi:hypothetical protein
VYDGELTIFSYGVKPPTEETNYMCTEAIRDQLIAAVPQAHKDFLRDLEWIIDLKTPFGLS